MWILTASWVLQREVDDFPSSSPLPGKGCCKSIEEKKWQPHPILASSTRTNQQQLGLATPVLFSNLGAKS